MLIPQGSWPRLTRFSCMLLVMLAVLSFAAPALAQTTISTGSIVGTVTDPSGAVVPGAKVTITNKATGQVINLITNSSGAYNSGALIPGQYTVQIGAKGFSTVSVPFTVLVGNTATGDIKLAVGQESQVIEVQASEVQVNTEQATVQGVITAQQIESLPFNGRNFLDLAQLEPGVQIQDGVGFDPTKSGFSSISFGGRSGRTARIEVDGLDISDETVGTTTQNISADSIQEFQASQSTLDLSTELTSSGSVNVVTRSGTNRFHGQGFYLFRDKNAGIANFPGGQDLPFQRNHVGGSFGGPIIKDKVFFFLNVEHIKQDALSPVTFDQPFGFNASFGAPFREKELLGKLDWQIGNYGPLHGLKAFYRFTYDNNSVLAPFSFGGPSVSPFKNLNNTPSHAVGLDFVTGNATHSLRFGYMKFQNHITDAVRGNPSIFDPDPRLEIFLGTSLESGPNLLAPQATFQSNKQVKYDGSYAFRSHVFRYGFAEDRILGGGFAKFESLAPLVISDPSVFDPAGPFAGGPANPLNYDILAVVMGNGQGFFTERPEFGAPAGGQFDTRLQWYVGDSWKMLPNLSISGGVRYVRDTGRTDSDLGVIPCSAIDTAVFTNPPCTGTAPLLDQFGAGLGQRVRQPNSNLGGNLGIVWDPFHTGKLVVRSGIGLYYENAVFNNVLFDRPARLTKGLFFANAVPCPSGVLPLPGGGQITSVDGLDIATQICGQPMGSVAQPLVDLQAQYQAAVATAGASVNPNFIGETLAEGTNSTGEALFAPNYRTPRSVQMNAGIQYQIRRGIVLNVDYLRNVQTHFLVGVDSNHVGDARFLNIVAAQNAIATTLADCGVASISAGLVGCPGGGNPVTAITSPLTIEDFAGRGLASGKQLFSGFPASLFGATPDTGAAFAGINPNVGENEMLFPIGRSVYDGLAVKLVQNTANPMPFVRNVSLQASYALSRFQNNAGALGGDQDFINNATDFRDPLHFFGPNALDRRHQFGVGAFFDFSHLRYSIAGHVSSRLAETLTVLNQRRNGEIFHTDLTGDGTVGDVIPGTNIGSFGRSIDAGSINKVINGFNSSSANTLTPAGQALVGAGLFTESQLLALGATPGTVGLAPANQANLGNFKSVDMRLSFPIKIREKVTIEPQVQAFNVFNFANFDPPGNTLSGVLSDPGTPGSANGTPNTLLERNGSRAKPGTGVFQVGSPRQLEFGLKLSF